LRKHLQQGVSTPLLYKDGRFLGLGAISLRGVTLRSDRIPIAPLIETRETIQ